MNKRQLLLTFCVIVFLAALIPLVMGAELLGFPIIENPYFPLGNLLTALGFIAMPCIFFFGRKRFFEPVSKRDRFFSKLYKTLIVIAALWIPLCYLLAGNLSNSFGNSDSFQGSQEAGEFFWMLNYGLAGLPIALFIVFLFLKLFPEE